MEKIKNNKTYDILTEEQLTAVIDELKNDIKTLKQAHKNNLDNGNYGKSLGKRYIESISYLIGRLEYLENVLKIKKISKEK